MNATALADPDDREPTYAERIEAARGAERIADEMHRRGVATFGELLDQLRAEGGGHA